MESEQIPVTSLMQRFRDDLRRGFVWLAYVSRDRSAPERGLITEWNEADDVMCLTLSGQQRNEGDGWRSHPTGPVVLTMAHYHVHATGSGYALSFIDTDGVAKTEAGFTISFERAVATQRAA